MKNIAFIHLLLCLLSVQSMAQQAIGLSLDDAVQLALNQSPDAFIVKKQFQIEEWQYKIYKAGLKPALSLQGTLPNFNRSLISLEQDDGTTVFVNQSQANYSLGLNLRQEIPFTGGSLFLSSGLNRIDIFGDKTSTSYLSSPISIGIQQPLFSFNENKWLRKTEPLRMSASMKEYKEEMEDVSIKAVNAYFDAYLAIINLQIAQNNKSNNDTLFRISKGRYNLGKIAENDLLQMELSLLNSEASVEASQLTVRVEELKLKRLLGIGQGYTINMQQLEKVPDVTIEYTDAVMRAKENNSFYDNLERTSVEAQQEIMRAKSGSRFSADLFASYGLNNTGSTISDAYKDPQNRQQVNVGILLPLIDWGAASTEIKIAKANAEVISTRMQLDRLEFEQEIMIQIQQFNLQKNQVRIAQKADEVATKRYEVAKNRYYIGKIGITDLNIALNEQDTAKRELIRSMRNYWVNYYNVRKLTLYDYFINEPVD